MAAVTTKRATQTRAIVEATLRALRTHGYSGTSLQRIAEEAGTSKRMVLHYFETREQLFDEVVSSVCTRVFEQVEQAVAAQADPAVALSDALDRLWDGISGDPGLHAVFFGLLAESVTDPSLRRRVSAVRDDYRDLIARLVAASHPEVPQERLDSIATLVLATIAGLTIDFLERGDNPALRRAFGDFKRRLVELPRG